MRVPRAGGERQEPQTLDTIPHRLVCTVSSRLKAAFLGFANSQDALSWMAQLQLHVVLLTEDNILLDEAKGSNTIANRYPSVGDAFQAHNGFRIPVRV